MKKLVNRLRKIVNDMPLNRKILGILLLTNAVLVMFGAGFGLQAVLHESNQLLSSTLATTTASSAQQMHTVLMEDERILRACAVDESLQRQCQNLAADSANVAVRAAAYQELSSLLQNYAGQYVSGDVDYIALRTSDMMISTNLFRSGELSVQTWQDLLDAAREADGRMIFVPAEEQSNCVYLLEEVRQVKPFNLQELGVLLVRLNLEGAVGRCTKQSNGSALGYYFLSNGQGQTLYAPQEVSAEEADALAARAQNSDGAVFQTSGHSWFSSCGTIPGLGWRYTAVLPYDSMVRARSFSVLVYFGILAVGLVLAMLLCTALIGKVTHHFDVLLAKMKTMEQRTELLAVKEDYSARADEIGELHRGFDHMAQKILDLIQRDYINQILMRDARLKALEAQIDPHFLYNVLASVTWRAKAVGDTQIPAMVEALSRLLRVTLDNTRAPFTLRRELDVVRDYATIQQLRFEDQLTISIEAPEELLDVEVPKLSIQPLVENAIRYAMAEGDEICKVEILVARDQDDVTISVRNTGTRFPPDMLRQLESGQLKTHGFGIGLLNIQKRLQMSFGEAYGLSFENENRCAAVTVRVPWHPVRREEKSDAASCDRG